MQPDYTSSDKAMIRFFNCDNREFMKDIPDKLYDLAIIDPEYGIGASEMTMGSGKHKFKKGKKWDKKPPEKSYFDELFRISKNQIIWGGNYFNLPLSPNWVIWDKLNPNLSFSEAELAWIRLGKLIRIFKYYSVNEDKIHPTQKPIKLYRWLLQNYAKPGQKIFDSHRGSMSHAIACDMEGFDLDICELDKEYFDQALNRFKIYKSQGKLF